MNSKTHLQKTILQSKTGSKKKPVAVSNNPSKAKLGLGINEPMVASKKKKSRRKNSKIHHQYMVINFPKFPNKNSSKTKLLKTQKMLLNLGEYADALMVKNITLVK